MSDRVTIDADKIIRDAQLMSGVSGIDPGLADRVRRMIASINDQGALTEAQKEAGSAQLRHLLFNRLLLASDRARLPGIAQERIERPVFVIGMARTGTSLLHSLLAEDEGAAAPVWWQSLSPSPPPGERPVMPARLHYAELEMDTFISRSPSLLALHPYWDKRAQAIVEDEEIFALDYRTAYPTKLFNIPTLNVDVSPIDPAGAYVFLRDFLQHFQWQQPVGRWVCKGVLHQFNLPSLFEAFPDAICIWPHRDPTEIMPSVIAIITALYGGISNWNFDAMKIAQAQVAGYRQALNAIAENPLVDDPRIHHVQFRSVAKDPVGTIRDFYAKYDLDFTDAFAGRIQAWLDDPTNDSGRYGRYQYSFEQYGLDRAQVKEAFAPYCRRFGLV